MLFYLSRLDNLLGINCCAAYNSSTSCSSLGACFVLENSPLRVTRGIPDFTHLILQIYADAWQTSASLRFVGIVVDTEYLVPHIFVTLPNTRV